MDDLIRTGLIALLIFYAGIIVIAIAIIGVGWKLVQSVLAGDYQSFLTLIETIGAVVAVYFTIGLILRKKGII